MPTYEYDCTGCGKKWQADQRITEDAATKCPSCGAEKARRLISGAPPFVLNGDGWAKDGYGK